MLFVQDLNTVEVVKNKEEAKSSGPSMRNVESLLSEILSTLQSGGKNFSDPLRNKNLLIGRA